MQTRHTQEQWESQPQVGILLCFRTITNKHITSQSNINALPTQRKEHVGRGLQKLNLNLTVTLKNTRINTRVPTVVEIKKALKELHNGRAAEANNVSPEVMKVDSDITANMLHPLFEKIWTEGEMPNDWKFGLLVKLLKKGDTANCDNWRGFTLLSVPSKVFTRVLLNRIKEHVNLRLQKEQAGFRPNHSCIEQINTLRIIIEQCIEWSSHLYTVFIDFDKAFDSVNREAMWKEVKCYGVPTQKVNLIKETYRGYTCRVVHKG